MNILQLSKYYHPYSGGIESVTRELVIGLKSSDLVTLSVVASNDQNETVADTIDQVNIHRLSQDFNIFSQPICFRLIKELQFHVKGKDILHLHTPNPLWELVLFFLKRKQQRLVITHHSDIVNQKLLAPFILFIQRLIYRRVDAFIIPTINHLSYSKILPRFKSKCHLIPFAFRFENIMKFTADPTRLQTIKQSFPPFAIFIGRLVSYKGLNILIEAMSKIHKSFHVVIVGKGPELESLKTKVESQKDSNRIHFLGRVEENLMLHYLHASEFLVLPSINQSENLGIVQLEAFAMKKAVIVSHLESGASSLIEHGKSGFLVPPGDAIALAEKMTLLFEDPNMAYEMGKNAFEHLQKNFRFESMIEEHLKLYRNLLDSKRKSKT